MNFVSLANGTVDSGARFPDAGTGKTFVVSLGLIEILMG